MSILILFAGETTAINVDDELVFDLSANPELSFVITSGPELSFDPGDS